MDDATLTSGSFDDYVIVESDSVTITKPLEHPLFPRSGGSPGFLALLDELRSLHVSKSADYGTETDPLANIRQGAKFVNIEPWRACMVRIADKVQRLKTFCRTGRLAHEGVRDTLMDMAAYNLLAIELLDESTRA